jgi:hypothetical protein
MVSTHQLQIFLRWSSVVVALEESSCCSSAGDDADAAAAATAAEPPLNPLTFCRLEATCLIWQRSRMLFPNKIMNVFSKQTRHWTFVLPCKQPLEC